jgi:hypothetical protein
VELYEQTRLVMQQNLLRACKYGQLTALQVHPENRGVKPGEFPHYFIQCPHEH